MTRWNRANRQVSRPAGRAMARQTMNPPHSEIRTLDMAFPAGKIAVVTDRPCDSIAFRRRGRSRASRRNACHATQQQPGRRSVAPCDRRQRRSACDRRRHRDGRRSRLAACPSPRRPRAPSGGHALPHNQLRTLARRGRHIRYCDERASRARSGLESLNRTARTRRSPGTDLGTCFIAR